MFPEIRVFVDTRENEDGTMASQAPAPGRVLRGQDRRGSSSVGGIEKVAPDTPAQQWRNTWEADRKFNALPWGS